MTTPETTAATQTLALTSTSPSVTVIHPANGSAREWWRSAVIYQVYPRSFADADGDGIGDIPGITSKLDHFVDLGVDALWLSPFYRSPQADAGYDVSDYREVDPLFGTNEDFETLLTQAHERGLRVIADLVPNHTSDEHAWFHAALMAGPGSPERARYLFREGQGEFGELPPNNWTSIFGGPAWTRVSERAAAATDGITDGQWYLHMFDTRQPDLDWEHPEVRSEFEDILRYWLDRGVDGFRIDVAHGMVKQPGLPNWDGNVSMVEGSSEAHAAADDGSTGSGNSGPMFDQEGVHDIYRAWHAVLADYDGDRALVAEAWVEPLSRLARYVRPDEMHQAFNFSYLTTAWDATALRAVVNASLAASDEVGAPTTWVLSNHDVVRHASRMGLTGAAPRPNGIGKNDPQPDAEVGLRRARAATLQMLGLPGSAYVYQGEELGLPEHTNLDDDLRQDPAWWRSGHTEAGRDGCRVPLPWEADKPGYGFGPTGRTWLPQPDSYRECAADIQQRTPGSTYAMYRDALAVRRENDLGLGSLGWVDDVAGSTSVLAFVNNGVLVVTNFGATPVALPEGAKVLVASGPLLNGTTTSVPTDTTAWVKTQA